MSTRSVKCLEVRVIPGFSESPLTTLKPVDGILVGTGDLRMSMGLPGGSLDGDEEIFLHALDRIRDATAANNIPIMGFGSTHQIMERRIKMGWQALLVHADFSGIYKSAVQTISSCQEIADRAKSGSLPN